MFDALTTERPYKKAMPFNEAICVMQDESGRHFDPDCLDAFLAVLADLAESDYDFTVERLRQRLDKSYPPLQRAAAAI